MRWSRFLLALTFCAILQYFLPQVWNGFRYVDFFLILVFYISPIVSARSSLMAGWISGFTQDFMLSPLYPLGLQALTKCIISYAISFMSKKINLEHPTIQIITLFLASCLNSIIMFILFAIFGQSAPFNLSHTMFAQASATTLFNLPILILMNRFKKSGWDR